ncbi:MAG: hypothetical protein K9G76_07350 [Bacteroidales bacterium]|nr:hypothetical protein [Bacteroidales bacterium]MCF8404603.1 hypothetical protein [Bacteroidales bacterium]
MHDLEPHYSWRHLYISSEDRLSPFYGQEYSEFEFSNAIYDHYIHPQWDQMGSSTLYLKILYANYNEGYCIIELLGEWNDCLHNDIMYLKRDIADILIENGINKFILIGENVLNFHAGETDYYQEWFEDIEDGWIAFVNFREHVLAEIEHANIDYYIAIGGSLNITVWRSCLPESVYENVNKFILKRLPS